MLRIIIDLASVQVQQHKISVDLRERGTQLVRHIREQVVHIPLVGAVHLAKGESIRTEIRCQYDRPSVRRLLRAASLRLERWIADDGRFALSIASPRP